MVVVYKWGVVAFDDYSLSKILTLPSEAKDDVPITFHDNGVDYQVPAGKVFIVGKIGLIMGNIVYHGRIGESDTADGAINKEILKGLGVDTIEVVKYLDVLGVYTAGKYVTAETTGTGAGQEIDSDTTLFGVEITA